jgi:serine/threonine-protein kinase
MDVLVRNQGIYRFGPFRLDPVGRTLTRDGAPVPLQARLFDTLHYLVEHHDRVVEREELMQGVWRGRTVDANNLGQAISGLRKALRDGVDGTHWLATAQRGYRIAVPVAFEPFEPPPSFAALFPPVVETRRPRWPWLVGAGLAVAAIVAAIAVPLLLPAPRPPEAVFAPPAHSVAVLAFANMTGDPAQAYLADGMAEELIDALSQVKALQVAARSSAFVFKNRPAAIAEIARALNVSAVLEGSVRGGGGRLRITARLVDGRTGFELWAKSFDRTAGETLAVETDIGAAVAGALRANLLPADVAQMALGGTADAAAFDDYLHGIVEERAGPDHARKAVAAYDAAIARDPQFARAFARRAIALAAVADYEAGDDAAALAATQQEAVRAAQRAVSLAPTLGAAHAALGQVLLGCRMDFRGAVAALARAEELAPGDAEVALPAADLQGELGHNDAVIAISQRIAAIDPLSPGAYQRLAQAYVQKSAWPAALGAVHRAEQLEKAPTLFDFQVHAAVDYLRGDDAAVHRDVAGDVPWHQQLWLAVADHALGHTADAMAAMNKLRSIAGDSAAFQYAEIYAQWGQRADALRWLNAAYRMHDPGLLELRADRLLDPIRSAPEYQAIEAAMGMPP